MTTVATTWGTFHIQERWERFSFTFQKIQGSHFCLSKTVKIVWNTNCINICKCTGIYSMCVSVYTYMCPLKLHFIKNTLGSKFGEYLDKNGKWMGIEISNFQIILILLIQQRMWDAQSNGQKAAGL